MKRPINLQHFAGEDFTPDVGGTATDDLVPGADGSLSIEDTEDADETTGAEDTDEAGGEEDAEPKTEDAKPPEPDDTTPWVKKRLARAERAYERKFMDELNAESDGHEIPRKDISKAVKLWNTLRVNPELSARVNQIVSEEIVSGKAKTLDRVAPTGGVDIREQRLALREAKLETRETDPVYRKYEQDILEWAEDEGLRIRSERDLKGAIREWKGAHARTLATQAESKKAAPARQPAKSTVAPPVGKQSQVSGKHTSPIDYRKTSTQDILKREGTSFYIPE